MALHGQVQAQDTTSTRRDSAQHALTPQDSARADSLRARAHADSLRHLAEQRRAADTIKAPIAHAEVPVLTDIDDGLRWDRTALFASGALTFGELLDDVPGLTVFRSGWIGSPHVGAYQGDFSRVRVFYDGIEIQPLDPRMGRMLDLSMVSMWPLEDARVEQTADEVRVYLGSWTVRSTTPTTRVDFSTGDLQTNAFRGFYGRRFRSGYALQLGADQFGTRDVRNGGDTHDLSLWGRVGWSKKKWTADASFLRRSRERDEQLALVPFTNLPKLDGSTSISYARVAYGDPGQGVWAQAVAASEGFALHGPPPPPIIDSIPGPDGGGPGGSPEHPDTIQLSGDTTRSMPQYVIAGGWSRGPLRLSATGRSTSDHGHSSFAPSVRASFEQRRATVSLFGERAPRDSVVRTELAARLSPLPYVSLRLSLGRRTPIGSTSIPASTSMLAEAGVRLGRVWLTGGAMTRDTSSLAPPIVFDTSYQAAAQGHTTGVFAGVRGKFWGDLGVDVRGVRYSQADAFRPQYQTRSQLYFESSFLRRFPSGHLHLMAALTHEYRSQALFPISTGDIVQSSQYRTWGFLLEIRLLTATVSYQYRNLFGEQYSQVPGFLMPKQMNFYGVRWNFFN